MLNTLLGLPAVVGECFRSLDASALAIPAGRVSVFSIFFRLLNISTSQRLNKLLISSHETRKDAAAPNIAVIRNPRLRSKCQKLCRRCCHRHLCRTAIVSIGHTFNSANHRLSHRSRDLYYREGTCRNRRSDAGGDRKSTRLNSSHSSISYAVFCLKKKKKNSNAFFYIKKKKKKIKKK